MSVLMHILSLQYYSNMTSMLFEDLPALFGAPLPKDGLMVSADYWKKSAYMKTQVIFLNMTLIWVCVFCERRF